METRGVCGWRIDGTDKIAFNAFDSSPTGVGLRIMAEAAALLRGRGADGLRAAVRALRLVQSRTLATPDEAQRAAFLYDSLPDDAQTRRTITGWATADYGTLFAPFQGRPQASLALGFLPDKRDFAGDGVFCQWAWIIDADALMLEIHAGRIDAESPGSRFLDLPRRRTKDGVLHPPVHPIARLPLGAPPPGWAQLAEDAVQVLRRHKDAEELTAHRRAEIARFLEDHAVPAEGPARPADLTKPAGHGPA